jgi:hypothetical protein
VLLLPFENNFFRLKKISFIEETIGRELSGNPRIEDKDLWKAFDSL